MLTKSVQVRKLRGHGAGAKRKMTYSNKFEGKKIVCLKSTWMDGKQLLIMNVHDEVPRRAFVCNVQTNHIKSPKAAEPIMVNAAPREEIETRPSAPLLASLVPGLAVDALWLMPEGVFPSKAGLT